MERANEAQAEAAADKPGDDAAGPALTGKLAKKARRAEKIAQGKGAPGEGEAAAPVKAQPKEVRPPHPPREERAPQQQRQQKAAPAKAAAPAAVRHTSPAVLPHITYSIADIDEGVRNSKIEKLDPAFRELVLPLATVAGDSNGRAEMLLAATKAFVANFTRPENKVSI
jgi:hypothetical protein